MHRSDLELIGREVQFNKENRAGIDGTLHRISCLRNKEGEISGVTIRIGRAVDGMMSFLNSDLTGNVLKRHHCFCID